MFKHFLSHETRIARRVARIARWDRPIEGSGARFRAWMHMLLSDHGVFRVLYLNKHAVTKDLWRSAQPTPVQLAQFAAEGGRTVVNLRGGREHGSWQLEKEACDRLGLELVDFVVRSRGAPDRESILNAKAFFESIAYPALVHCKSGADRAGFAAALYLVVMEGARADEALKQLSLRFGHVRQAKTGILDAFFERWRDEGEAAGMSFLEWVETRYDPDALERDFHAGRISTFFVDRIIRRE
ncbi:MAG TPA: sulfur transferase domain-containing protein [Saliniramus sp.]|nr:sulfur transferase domain-containing protein [Saliniramus sp.]